MESPELAPREPDPLLSPRSPRSTRVKSPRSPLKLGNFSKIFEQLSLSRPEPRKPLAQLPTAAPPGTPRKTARVAQSVRTAEAAPPLPAPGTLVSERHHTPQRAVNLGTGLADFQSSTPQALSSISPGETSTYNDDSSGFDDSQPPQTGHLDTPQTTPPTSATRGKPMDFMSEEAIEQRIHRGARTVSPLSNADKLMLALLGMTPQYGQSAAFPATRSHGQYHTHEAASFQRVSISAMAMVPPPDPGEMKRQALMSKLTDFVAYDRVVQRFHMLPSKDVHIFVDLSNIIISFRRTFKQSRGIPLDDRHPVHFSFERFHLLLDRGRQAVRKELAGSVAAGAAKRPKYMRDAEKQGYKLHIEERVVKKAKPRRRGGIDYSSSSSDETAYKMGERDVDSRIHVMMLESVIDRKPGTMVLATGDAALNGTMDGFRRHAERALQKGWALELVAWKCCMSTLWKDPSWTQQWGNRFRVIELDEFVDDLYSGGDEAINSTWTKWPYHA